MGEYIYQFGHLFSPGVEWWIHVLIWTSISSGLGRWIHESVWTLIPG